MKDIKIVIGANFGDEGKGKLTDYYTKNADNCIVVCSNGGAQRGHTVLKSDGTRHVFHHFGSGTLNGADTYLPEDFILNPLVFKEEWEELKKLGFKLALCSNLAMPYGKIVSSLLPLLDAYAWSYEVAAIKPEPKIYQSLIDQLDCQASEVLFIGDTALADFTGPTAFGMSARLINRNNGQILAEVLNDIL